MFEALRRHLLDSARESFADGACLYSLDVDAPVRIDFCRARVVDGLGDVIHERMFAVRALGGRHGRRFATRSDPGKLTPAPTRPACPPSRTRPEPRAWLNEHALVPFLDEVRGGPPAEVERIPAARRDFADGAVSSAKIS